MDPEKRTRLVLRLRKLAVAIAPPSGAFVGLVILSIGSTLLDWIGLTITVVLALALPGWAIGTLPPPSQSAVRGFEHIPSGDSKDLDCSGCLQYYQIVRDRVSSLDSLIESATLQGMTFGVALLATSSLVDHLPIGGSTASGVRILALILSVVSIVVTEAYVVVVQYYSSMIAAPVGIAKAVESHILSRNKPWSDVGLSYQIDKEGGLVGRNSWVIPTLVLSVIVAAEVAGLAVLIGT